MRHLAISWAYRCFGCGCHRGLLVGWRGGPPWRWGIRHTIRGRTITFTVNEPGKFSISWPGDYRATAEMLFLIANLPESDAPSANASGVRYFGPGVYRNSIDAHTGDRIYLAPGCVCLLVRSTCGAWRMCGFGAGTVVYEGPQDPNADEGWMPVSDPVFRMRARDPNHWYTHPVPMAQPTCPRHPDV